MDQRMGLCGLPEREGRVDHRLHVARLEQALRRLFQKLGIPFVRQQESKFARALKRAKMH